MFLALSLFPSPLVSFVLLSLFILGGSAVEYFALAMMIGILIGTYSSIFVASTSLYFLGANAEQRNDL